MRTGKGRSRAAGQAGGTRGSKRSTNAAKDTQPTPAGQSGWRPVPDLPGVEVHPSGAVRGATVRLYEGRRHVRGRKVAPIIAQVFALPGWFAGAQCHHINGIKDDDRLTNLRWVDPSAHSVEEERERHFEEKLDIALVLLARQLHRQGEGTAAISQATGLDARSVRHVIGIPDRRFDDIHLAERGSYPGGQLAFLDAFAAPVRAEGVR